MIMKQMPPSTHGAHEQQSTLEALCYKHLFELYKLLHGAFLSIGFPHHWHFHPYYYSVKSHNLYLRNGKMVDAFQNFDTLASPILSRSQQFFQRPSILWVCTLQVASYDIHTYHPPPVDQTTIVRLITSFSTILYSACQVRSTQLWYSNFSCLLLSLFFVTSLFFLGRFGDLFMGRLPSGWMAIISQVQFWL